MHEEEVSYRDFPSWPIKGSRNKRIYVACFSPYALRKGLENKRNQGLEMPNSVAGRYKNETNANHKAPRLVANTSHKFSLWTRSRILRVQLALLSQGSGKKKAPFRRAQPLTSYSMPWLLTLVPPIGKKVLPLRTVGFWIQEVPLMASVQMQPLFPH